MPHADFLAGASALDREYVALCLTEQVVRIRLAAARAARESGTHDCSPALLEHFLDSIPGRAKGRGR